MIDKGRVVFCNASDEVAALRQWLQVGVDRMFPDCKSALDHLLLLPRGCTFRVWSITVCADGDLMVQAESPWRIDCNDRPVLQPVHVMRLAS